jgi:hypothetical protein
VGKRKQTIFKKRWFNITSFVLRNMTEQREKFCLVEQSLPRDAMHLEADLVKSPPAELMYNALKDWLCFSGSYQLTSRFCSPTWTTPGSRSCYCCRPSGGHKDCAGSGGRGRRPVAAAATKQKKKQLEEPEPSKAAKQATELCLRHWRYGTQAFSCDGDCCWPETGGPGATKRRRPRPCDTSGGIS